MFIELGNEPVLGGWDGGRETGGLDDAGGLTNGLKVGRAAVVRCCCC